jgi:hypothetical protein
MTTLLVLLAVLSIAAVVALLRVLRDDNYGRTPPRRDDWNVGTLPSHRFSA